MVLLRGVEPTLDRMKTGFPTLPPSFCSNVGGAAKWLAIGLENRGDT